MGELDSMGIAEMNRDVRQTALATPAEFTILVADDDWNICELVGSVLERAGFSVLYASNGLEALARLDGVQLLLTDLVMPECEGLETIRLCKSRYPEAKVVAMSGAFQGQFLEVALLLGADVALGKPLALDVLLDHVYRLLEIPRVPSDPR